MSLSSPRRGLKNSFAGAVEQRPPSAEDLARRSEARAVQKTAIELRDEEAVEAVIRWSAVDQDMDEVASVTGVVVGDGALVTILRPYRRAPPFAVGVKHVCCIVLDCLPKSMTDVSRSVNGQVHVAGDGPNGHVPFPCSEVVVAAEDFSHGEGDERTF